MKIPSGSCLVTPQKGPHGLNVAPPSCPADGAAFARPGATPASVGKGRVASSGTANEGASNDDAMVRAGRVRKPAKSALVCGMLAFVSAPLMEAEAGIRPGAVKGAPPDRSARTGDPDAKEGPGLSEAAPHGREGPRDGGAETSVEGAPIRPGASGRTGGMSENQIIRPGAEIG